MKTLFKRELIFVLNTLWKKIYDVFFKSSITSLRIFVSSTITAQQVLEIMYPISTKKEILLEIYIVKILPYFI